MVIKKFELRLERDAGGGFTIPASHIAETFGWSPEIMREKMRRGLIRSVIERGEGCDEGRWRLSVRCGNRRWQAGVDEDGHLISQQFDFVHAGALQKQAADV